MSEKFLIAECESGRLLLAKSGIGKYSAYNCTLEVLNRYRNIRAVFSVGIAGALSPDLKIGDIVVGNCIIDYRKGQPVEEKHSQWNAKVFFSDNIRYGKIISSDSVLTNRSKKQSLFLDTNGLCVEMESAGVIKACERNEIQFCGIKIISDLAEKRAVVEMLRSQMDVTVSLGKFIKNSLSL